MRPKQKGMCNMNEFDYLAKAKNNMEKAKYHEVISLCGKALKINSELPDAYDFRANAKYEIGEYDSAIDDLPNQKYAKTKSLNTKLEM